MAKAMQDAFNQQLSYLDNTVQPQTFDAWNKFLYQNQDTARRLSGLYNPQGMDEANAGFDKGVSDYEGKANDMYANAGYTPQEQQGQRVATAAGFAAPYAQAQNQMKLQQQRTGNSAGVNASIAGAGREKGRMISQGLGGLEKGFGDARMQGQKDAMSLSQFPQMARLQRMQGERDTASLGFQGSSQLQGAYGTGLSGQLGAAGLRGGNVNANPSFLKQLGAGVAGGLGTAIGNIPGAFAA